MRKLILLLLLCCSGLAVATSTSCANFLNEGLYLDDKKHGTWTTYNTYTYESCDNDWSEGDVINAKKEGWWVESNVDPRLVDDFKATASRTQGNYINGKQEGKVTWWYENGQKQKAFESNYINGEPDGTWTLWDEDGTIKKVENYQNGVRLHY